MTRLGVALAAVVLVAACGGGSSRVDRAVGGASPTIASGPISEACQRAGRKAANRRLCGCVQAVANRDLSSSDQLLSAEFFSEPHQAQEIRQSDNPRHEAFWKRYTAFAARAEQTCRGL